CQSVTAGLGIASGAGTTRSVGRTRSGSMMGGSTGSMVGSAIGKGAAVIDSSARSPEGFTAVPVLLVTNSRVLSVGVNPLLMVSVVNAAEPLAVSPKLWPLSFTLVRLLSTATFAVRQAVDGSKPLRSNVVRYV